ncbi:MAG: hypothetical protein CM1200mP24_05280 [Gammaproteobacteria bacterium]|nr:MAG: hypothetical protein CM1200mP24_05280 [Gammaproteobacteria bacterium]
MGAMEDNPALKTAYEALSGRIDVSGEPSDWFEVTQGRINDFADVTLDHQWIHSMRIGRKKVHSEKP